MIIHYLTPEGEVLLTTPQTCPPLPGSLVTLGSRTGQPPRTYRVTQAPQHWYLTTPAEGCRYYSLTDAAEEHVHIVLIEDERS